MSTVSLGQEIRRRRLLSNQTTKQLADCAGIREAYLVAIEEDREEPSATALARIAAGLEPGGACYSELAALMRGPEFDISGEYARAGAVAASIPSGASQAAASSTGGVGAFAPAARANAPPAQSIELAGSRPASRLWRRNLVLTFILMWLTLGFYVPLWFLRRRGALNEMAPTTPLSPWPAAIVFAYLAVRDFLLLGPARITPESAPIAALVLQGVTFVAAIVLIGEAFRVKAMLEDYLTPPADGTLQLTVERAGNLSGLMTFFLGILYLQHVINSRIVS